MTNLILYNKKDIEIIKDNIDDIQFQVKKLKATTMEPTIDEFNKAMNIIINYIKGHKRVIYGGYARNQIIKHKNPDNKIYDDYEKADVDFYSYEPVVDLINLADILHQRGFTHIQGKPAYHEETYTLFVNFEKIADISYMPKHLLFKMPIITIKNVKYTHPKFMFIDMLRVFNDPMTSYFVLEKTFKRTIHMIEEYPFEKKECDLPKLPTLNKLDEVRKMIQSINDVIITGHYAYYYYKYKAENKKVSLDIPYYDIISINIENDAKIIYTKLREIYSQIIVKEYRPFYQFLDQRIEFYDNKNNLILRLYGNYGKCIPYISLSKKNVKISTFSYTLMFSLIMEIYHNINNNNNETEMYQCMFSHLLQYRQKYLKDHKKTIIDDTPFKEFVIQCSGEATDPKRVYLLDKSERKRKRQRVMTDFVYHPETSKGFDPNKIKYENTSGNIITEKGMYDKILLLDNQGDIINIHYESDTSSIDYDSDDQLGGSIIEDDFENEIKDEIFIANEEYEDDGFVQTS